MAIHGCVHKYNKYRVVSRSLNLILLGSVGVQLHALGHCEKELHVRSIAISAYMGVGAEEGSGGLHSRFGHMFKVISDSRAITPIRARGNSIEGSCLRPASLTNKQTEDTQQGKSRTAVEVG